MNHFILIDADEDRVRGAVRRLLEERGLEPAEKDSLRSFTSEILRKSRGQILVYFGTRGTGADDELARSLSQQLSTRTASYFYSAPADFEELSTFEDGKKCVYFVENASDGTRSIDESGECLIEQETE